MYINITASETGNNKGSSGELVHYLEKENRQAAKQQPEKESERWFSNGRTDIQPHEVRAAIDKNVAKLLRVDAKFFLVNISPSQKELRHLMENYGDAGREEQLKRYAEKIMDEYARNFKRPGISGSKDLVWFGKLEHYRYYSYKDKEVRQGKKQNGARKEGDQLHIQVIVSRKDATNKIKLSPQNKSRGSNEEHSKKVGQFDRVAFKASGEHIFDQTFAFERGLSESFRYANGIKNGTAEERQNLNNEQAAKPSESKQANMNPTAPTTQATVQNHTISTKDVLEALLMPTRDEATASLLGIKRRKRKGHSNDQEMSL
ncbi:hypothetical protein BDD43_3524 [Mucilaginibacter gracilis]|uniref:Molybdopterin-guanine dinucleotide biosynthesis protein MobB n=1 Tax=Mucilaginibacter gracilis TaxID=423350 RepID=A0A495J5Q6_9SPHI|nr:DUF5712 family protein [Mucilaginibacter gracilis]RKR83319.1 hypothetical protein BDD43_3524 [Mucilaginibacter gracilis]